MKRKIISLILIFTLVVSVFVGCTNSTAANANPSSELKSRSNLSAYVVENNNGELLVSSKECGLIFVSTKPAKLKENGKEISASEIKPGMTVKIGFDGAILESYPGQIPNTETVTVVARQDDRISLFKEAFEHIYENREELEDEKTIALDFSKITSLSDEQKSALEYLLRNYFSTKTEANVIIANLQDLEERGAVKNLCFPGGILLSVEEKDEKTLSVRWWKSGLCASGFDDCTAKLSGDGWKIDYGAAWIS